MDQEVQKLATKKIYQMNSSLSIPYWQGEIQMKTIETSKYHYISLQSWMVTNLGLRGDELIIFAIIYGFSQDGKSLYKGSSNYLSFWTGRSKETILNKLKSLRKKRMIARIIKSSNINADRYFCDYYATITRVPQEIQEKLLENWAEYSLTFFPKEDD